MLDGGAHFYDCYQTKDGKHISIGSIEPQFYDLLLDKLEVDKEYFKAQNNTKKWSEYKAALKHVFLTKTRDEWCDILEGTDVCFAPVLDYKEAQEHPHNKERKTYFELDNIVQPAPAPRFSRTPSEVKSGSPKSGEHTEEILKSWGIS